MVVPVGLRRLVTAASTLYCFKEFVAKIVVCDGHSMLPTIAPDGRTLALASSPIDTDTLWQTWSSWTE